MTNVGTLLANSYTVSISLALAFFNLLPIPHLDGHEILSSFFSSLSSSAYLDSAFPPLAHALTAWRASSLGRWASVTAQRRARIQRVLELVTTYVALFVVGGTLLHGLVYHQ
jgi:Zn-dependent protease